MKTKSRVRAIASCLLLASVAVVVPAVRSDGAPTLVGECVGQVGLATMSPGFVDTTNPLTVKGKLLRNLNRQVLGGSCSARVRTGDPIHPAGGTISLTPKAVALSLSGNISCAWTTAARAADPNAATAWPVNGTITWTMNELNDLGRPYRIRAFITLTVDAALGAELFHVNGTVISGPAVGAQVTGSIWADPAYFDGGAHAYNTGYTLDNFALNGCSDGVAGNGGTTQAVFGGGGASTTPLSGGTAANATGFQFLMP